MSVIDSTSEAYGVGVGAKIESFGIASENVQSNILVAAQYDPLKTTVVDDVPQLILNEADAGDKIGFGYPGHRLIAAALKGTNGAGSVYWAPQADPGGAVAAIGEIAWSGSVAASGTISLRIANFLFSVGVAKSATLEAVSDAVVAAVNADPDTPVVATKTAVTFETVFTAKSKNAAGDLIAITLSALQGEALPTSLVGAITAMTGGVGVPLIQDTLDAMGLNDDVNELNFTALVHNNGLDTTTIDAISAYVGDGNEFVGTYSKLVGRPFVSLQGDTTVGSAGLIALKVITDARLSDRANGILGAPDEDEIPSEIAAYATGIIGRIGQADPSKNYSGQILSGIGGRSTSANRWTNDYSSGRDFAVKNGISPTDVISAELFLQNVITFFRPANIPTASNGFKSFRSFWITRNILNTNRLTYEGPKYQGYSITSDKSLVTDFEAAQNARDLDDVRTTLNNLIDFYVSKGWIFDGDFAKKNSTVAIRSLGNGFDINLKYQETGEGQVMNIQQTFDKNIAA